MKRMTSLVALLLLVLCSCTNSGATVRALKNQGFTDIRPGGYAWFACSGDDTWQTKFTATNPRGERVSGTVCCGLFLKDCTVRW